MTQTEVEATTTDEATGAAALGSAWQAPASDSAASGALARSKWLHVFSVLAVCLVWPLIWVGGMVTTMDAGMAVPDWPGTYGYNLFLYPLSTWVSGPFDLFIEHGHRLLASVVGMVAIVMFAVAIKGEPRRWVIALSGLVLAMVIGQGVLGGVRVLLSDRSSAMIHGCVGPIVFVLCCLCASVTRRSWWDRKGFDGQSKRPQGVGKLALGFAIAFLCFAYLQLVLGAQVRHVQPLTSTKMFTHLVVTHVAVAAGLLAAAPVLLTLTRRCGDLTLSRLGVGLIMFVTLQVLLGVSTWVVKYGWPEILSSLPFGEGYLVKSKGFFESMVVTAHVAVGSLILANAALIVMQCFRQNWLAAGVQSVQRSPSGVAPETA
ncbi:MAG: hypothetical protein CBB71_15940 [Rhodopirellula sp. TMED11]|nr:MAG: hypothetical protein CBB71_15940 [Rhodopirellula sp. TMED11]